MPYQLPQSMGCSQKKAKNIQSKVGVEVNLSLLFAYTLIVKY